MFSLPTLQVMKRGRGALSDEYDYARICRSNSAMLGRAIRLLTASAVGLYTILSLTIWYGIYCNEGGSRGNNISRNSVCNEGGEWGAQTKVVFAKNIVDSCTYASN